MKDFDIFNFGFVILCPQRNYGGLKATVRSIKCHFPDKPCVCVVGSDATKEEVREFGEVCRTIQAGKTYSSLLNIGANECRGDWIMYYMAGMPVRHGLMKKYHTFCGGKNDIMYQVIDKKWVFDDASINGLFFHKDTMKDCGEFTDEEEDFRKVKLLWAENAMKKNYRFCALVGVPR